MRSSYIAAVAAVLLVSVPAVTPAQSFYHVTGCGNSGDGPIIPNAVCVDGTLTVAAPYAYLPGFGSYRETFDLNVTLAPTFHPTVFFYEPTGEGFDAIQPVTFTLGPTGGHVTLVGTFVAPVQPTPFAPVLEIFQFRYRSAVDDLFSTPAVQIFPTVTPVPEPATLALTLGGLAVLGAGAWRRRRA